MWGDYFIIFGVLLAIYFSFRFLVWGTKNLPKDDSYEVQYRLFPRSKGDDTPGKPIDALALSDRLNEIRCNRYEQVRDQSQSFKRSVLVESTREKVAKSGYFQKTPPPPEPPAEEEHGLIVLLA